LAQQTGFVQRRRQISGADFVQGLVFGWLHQPETWQERWRIGR
jgi:hypothetical protein